MSLIIVGVAVVIAVVAVLYFTGKLGTLAQVAKSDLSPPIGPNSIPMGATFWTIGPIINGKSDSPGMPLNPTQEGTNQWGFDFPPQDGVHYVTCQLYGSMNSNQTMTAKFTVSGTGKLTASPGGGTSAPKARLYFQRAGDDWATNGYRWWSTPATLEDGDHTLSVKLDYANWISVGGNLPPVTQTDFQNALNSVINVGITFGADFAGHGLYSVGPAHFTMHSFTVG